MERDCDDVIAWVKSNHPGAGAYPRLALPPGLAHLAAYGLVDAVAFSDGRVALLFQTDAGFISAWEGFIYCSGPLTAAEVGLDHPDPWFVKTWGYPELRTAGFQPGVCVFAMLNTHEYIVGDRN
jgi:hypothetical protein